VKSKVARPAKQEPPNGGFHCKFCGTELPDTCADCQEEVDDGKPPEEWPGNRSFECKFCCADLPDTCEDCQAELDEIAAYGGLRCKYCHEDMPEDFDPFVDIAICSYCQGVEKRIMGE
jgi:DNA-directed RNA polymerase subunit RPC12/RpoP